MGLTLTAANSIIQITVAGVGGATLAGFAADDIFNTPSIAPTETVMGVDGNLSGGFTFREIKQDYSIMPDNPATNDLFTQWQQQQQSQQDAFTANGIAIVPGLLQKWIMTKGFLTGFPPVPSAGKLYKARKFEITWERVNSAPT
jgi:hypothetical protein